ERDGLRGAGLLAGDVRRRGRRLADAEQRLAGCGVEQEAVAGLGELRDRGYVLAAMLHRHDDRRAREVVVPQVVVQRLEVPEPLAGAGVERERAVGEEVVTLAAA